jgi:ABC-type Fe3+ transport system permease subunit
MTATSILAMAMVIYLFGGYVDSPDEQRISTAVQTIRPNVYPPSGSNEKEIMSINPRRNAIVAWGFSTWFAFLSPVIGILLGLFGAFLFLR